MSKKIIICNECQGEGLVHREKCVDYHNNYHDEWTEECDSCKGSGRLMEETVVDITLTAYFTKEVTKR